MSLLSISSFEIIYKRHVRLIESLVVHIYLLPLSNKECTCIQFRKNILYWSFETFWSEPHCEFWQFSINVGLIFTTVCYISIANVWWLQTAKGIVLKLFLNVNSRHFVCLRCTGQNPTYPLQACYGNHHHHCYNEDFTSWQLKTKKNYCPGSMEP